MRLFCMDLHISVIADFKSLGMDVDVTDWTLSGHAHIMGRARDNPKHINANTWQSLNPEMIANFQAEYHDFLSSFDGFIVGHAACFAQIYEKYNKPIIWINSCRFDLPYCWSGNLDGRAKYIACLARLHQSELLTVVSNNKADQLYTFRATGIRPQRIPSLCLYTKMKYRPVRQTFLCYTGGCPPNPRITQKHEIGNFAWQTVAEFKGVIHFPYEISTMSLFEQFSAGCPMFFPSRAYLTANAGQLTSISNYWGSNPMPYQYGDLSDIKNWVDLADFYDTFTSPNTQYFDSQEHLDTLLDAFVYVDDRDERARYVTTVQARWRDLLSDIRTRSMRTKEPVHLCYNRLPVLADVVFDVNYEGSGVSAQHVYPRRHTLAAGDVVFVKTDLLEWFITNKPVTVPITLVTGVADLSPGPLVTAAILGNLNIRRWIGCNITASHPKIYKVPIGVGEPGRQNCNHDELLALHATRTEWNMKQNDVCIPYHGVGEGRVDRPLVPTLGRLPFAEYMKAISNHKFVVAMPGGGIDTHRFCEILLMGSAPVVLRSGLDDMHEQFPCLIVDSFDSIDTSRFVWDEAKYQYFLDVFWLTPAGVRAMLG